MVDGSFGFGGEESAGASFLRKNGGVWTTDKGRHHPQSAAAEITAVTGKDPGQHYQELRSEFGTPYYTRDRPSRDARAKVTTQKALAGVGQRERTLAGEPILHKLTRAPANDAAIGGLKVVTENGWFAARPSGTENEYKIYAESFKGAAHLDGHLGRSPKIVSAALERSRQRRKQRALQRTG